MATQNWPGEAQRFGGRCARRYNFQRLMTIKYDLGHIDQMVLTTNLSSQEILSLAELLPRNQAAGPRLKRSDATTGSALIVANLDTSCLDIYGVDDDMIWLLAQAIKEHLPHLEIVPMTVSA